MKTQRRLIPIVAVTCFACASAVTPIPTSEQPETAIVYSRSGGIGGEVQRWILYIDGRVTNSGSGEFRVPAEGIEAILSASMEDDFLDWRLNQLPPNVCSDCFTYSLMIKSGGVSNQVTFITGHSARSSSGPSVSTNSESM